MALIQWSRTYSVQINEIDQQHQRLVQMINELYDAMKAGKGKVVVGKIIDGLVNYTQSHFAVEERYFEKFNYAEAAVHKREHAAFVKKAGDFRAGFNSGQMGLSMQILDFLSDWLRDHIQGSDKKYAAVFLQNGVK